MSGEVERNEKEKMSLVSFVHAKIDGPLVLDLISYISFILPNSRAPEIGA